MKRRNNQISIIRLPKLLMRWQGDLGSAHAFKGILDYENWAMRQSPPEEQVYFDNLGMTPEQFRELHEPVNFPRNEKEKVLAQAKVVRAQIEKAIEREDYEAAKILRETLDVLEIKYNRL